MTTACCIVAVAVCSVIAVSNDYQQPPEGCHKVAVCWLFVAACFLIVFL